MLVEVVVEVTAEVGDGHRAVRSFAVVAVVAVTGLVTESVLLKMMAWET
jgi:hypothetical protein